MHQRCLEKPSHNPLHHCYHCHSREEKREEVVVEVVVAEDLP